MKVLVLNGSPAGKNSITLQTVLFLEKSFPSCSFEILQVGQRIKALEKDFTAAREALQSADLILFCYPVYTFLVPAQLHRFLELMKERQVSLSGKYATQISTSKHFYDTTAHQFIEDNCADLGLRYIRGLSADMEDLLTEKGREEAVTFFRFVLWSVAKNWERTEVPATAQFRAVCASAAQKAEKGAGGVVLVTDLSPESGTALQTMIDRFCAVMPRNVRIVDLREFPFAGGCLGCFHCAADGTCVYRDGFEAFLRERIQSADAIVYAYTIRDHSMGSRFKLYDDRQFCNGHRTVTMGKPVGYLVDGPLDRESNLRTLMEARAQVGGNFLAGIATDQRNPDGEIDQLADTLEYAITRQFQMPQNFYGVGGLKIFRDLIFQMRGLMREDHRFYKEHGFYDFPQKRRGRIAVMYLVGTMMRSRKLSGKMSGKMTEGMIMPYQKVLRNALPQEEQS